MKILKIPSYYEPELISSSHLSKDLERAYVDAGMSIEVYVPTPTRGVSSEVREKYKKIKYEERLDGKIKVHRFSMVRELRNPIFRAIRYSLVNMRQCSLAKKAKDVDVIMGGSTPPTQGIYCAKIAKSLSKKYGKKVPYIYTLQDVFPDSLATTGLAKKGSLLYKIGNRIANKIYESADVIITISEDIKANIMAKGVPEDKIRVIPNWIDTESVCHVPKKNNALYGELGLNKDTFKVVYAGNLGLAQGVDTLLDAAELLCENKNVEFIIFGKGAEEERLKKRAELLGNVHFFPLQPADRVPEVYSLADASVVMCKKGTGGAGTPSKTWSIMGCGVPVLAAFDEGSELCNIINENKLGLCSEPENARALADNILSLCETPEEKKAMGENARKYVENFASKEICTKKYVDIIKSFE